MHSHFGQLGVVGLQRVWHNRWHTWGRRIRWGRWWVGRVGRRAGATAWHRRHLTSTAAATAEQARLAGALGALDGLSAADFAQRFAAGEAAAPLYDRATIAGLDKIQASSLALNQSELAALDVQGFALTDRISFPSFTYGYQTLYLEDLPLYVSADSILDALHSSYDSILKALEQQQLSAELSALLAGMHARLGVGAGKEWGSDVVHDADLFIAVARSLLSGSEVAPVAGGSAKDVHELVGLAAAAEGVKTFQLFGVLRKDEDFSQFKPRGHYTDSVELTRYFKAMMWLGRVDLRLLETESDGSQVFRRQQLEVMLLLRELIDTELRVHFDRVDRTVAAFVGEPDYMVLSQVDSLVADLGIKSPTEVAGISDDVLAQAIIDGGYGAQRISSHIMMNDGEGTLPLRALLPCSGSATSSTVTSFPTSCSIAWASACYPIRSTWPSRRSATIARARS